MDIIKNDGRILLEKRTTVELLNQRAISHEDHSCVVIHCRIKAHLVTDLVVVAP